MTLAAVVRALASALLIGMLVGAQRETSMRYHPGLRDFLLIAIAGGIAGLVGNPVLAAGIIIAIIIAMSVFHFEARKTRAGITTEIAAIATYGLAYFAASNPFDFAQPIAIAVALITIVCLEAKQWLRHLVREDVTEAEFNATLGFVAVVLVIYPLLPTEAYGPYSFFKPRQVWMFVILISSISYIGYFLEKYLGGEKGLVYTSILGGLASTTAATLHLSRVSKDRPEESFGLWRALVIANTVQFPRTLLIVAAASPPLALVSTGPLLMMTIFGVVLAEILRRWPHPKAQPVPLKPGNPFRIKPALRFGIMFTIVVFISKAATALLGASAFYATSLIGGLVDVATVIAPAGDLLKASRITVGTAELAVLLALLSNAILKVFITFSSGTRSIAWRATFTFTLWTIAAALGWWVMTMIPLEKIHIQF
jgi:uncharacterized membrane protein (DUF4010 family)